MQLFNIAQKADNEFTHRRERKKENERVKRAHKGELKALCVCGLCGVRMGRGRYLK